jgi:hypothetical protein
MDELLYSASWTRQNQVQEVPDSRQSHQPDVEQKGCDILLATERSGDYQENIEWMQFSPFDTILASETRLRWQL